MHISWLGGTCVRLTVKHLDEDVTVIIDPYKPKSGDFPRSFSPTIALFSKGEDGAVSVGSSAFTLSTLGECEVKNVMITAFPSADGTGIFKINAEQMSVAHFGHITKKPDVADLEKLGHVDIALVPVGGGDYLSPDDASDLVTALEPRIVIPIASQSDNDPGAKPVADFIKALGLKPDVTDKKIILRKKDLPQEETKLMILEKSS